MKITLIGHASILIDIGGITILSDPWWRGPCFGAQWWNYPLPHLAPLEDTQVDYIYISHGHHDHFHPGTLATLSKQSKVLISSSIGLAGPVRELGFDVIELNDDEEVVLTQGGVHCRIIRTHGHDTLMAVSDGKEVCVNINDALHSAPREVQENVIARLKALYAQIDYVFCGYGTASHFPNCYVIPGKDRIATAGNRQKYFNLQWAKIIEDLRPAYGFPFAADVAFFENDLLWANEPTHNSTRPTITFQETYSQSSVMTVDIAPGFTIENGKIIADVRRQPVVEAKLRKTFAAQIERANRYGIVEQEAVEEIIALMRDNLAVCIDYLQSYHRDYRFIIRFRNTDLGICVEKRGKVFTLTCEKARGTVTQRYALTYTVRLQYLKWALTRKYGDEIMFVGSGGVFEYDRQVDVKHNLHRELIFLLRKQNMAPLPRYGNKSRLVFSAKQAVKRLIGRPNEDLYDLNAWTVYEKK